MVVRGQYLNNTKKNGIELSKLLFRITYYS